METKADTPPVAEPMKIIERFLVPPAAGTPQERAARVRRATSGLRAGMPVTKAMYRPGR